MMNILTLALALILAGGGCAKRVDLEKVPVGTEVEVTRQDGGVVRGTLAARDDKTVRVNVGKASHSVPAQQIADVQLVNETPAAPAGDREVPRVHDPGGHDARRPIGFGGRLGLESRGGSHRGHAHRGRGRRRHGGPTGRQHRQGRGRGGPVRPGR